MTDTNKTPPAGGTLKGFCSSLRDYAWNTEAGESSLVASKGFESRLLQVEVSL